jgi:hypothetical protein
MFWNLVSPLFETTNNGIEPFPFLSSLVLALGNNERRFFPFCSWRNLSKVSAAQTHLDLSGKGKKEAGLKQPLKTITLRPNKSDSLSCHTMLWLYMGRSLQNIECCKGLTETPSKLKACTTDRIGHAKGQTA